MNLHYQDQRNLLWALLIMIFILSIVGLTVATKAMEPVTEPDPVLAREIFTTCITNPAVQANSLDVSHQTAICADIAQRLSRHTSAIPPRKPL